MLATTRKKEGSMTSSWYKMLHFPVDFTEDKQQGNATGTCHEQYCCTRC